MPSGDSKSVVVARVADAFGVRGQIKVRSFTELPESLLQHKNWVLNIPGDGERSFEVAAAKVQGGNVIALLEGLSTRDEALELKGADVQVLFSALPKLPPGEFYWSELLGLKVIDIDGSVYGIIKQIMETGANDVLVVQEESTHLIPYTDSVIKEINLEQGTVHVDWFKDY